LRESSSDNAGDSISSAAITIAMSQPAVPEWLKRLNDPPTVSKNKASIPDPPGYTPPSSVTKKTTASSKQTATVRKAPSSEETDALKVKKAWELALGPAKQLPMNAFGMYMSGSSLQIFSIMMVFMLFKTPFTAVLNINSAFARFESAGNKDKILLAKITYILTNMMLLALGIWKVNHMGLLP
jgi:ER membrane protein complex subunit 4